jgi:cell division protein FtsI/penicillin-binding protein 2
VFIKQAKAFGFGEDIPLAYPIETSQLTNEGSFKNEITLANSGYGQGEVVMSALHLALAYTPLVTEGNLLKPVLELKNAGEPEVWHEKVMSAETANTIKKDLIQVIESPNGTANEARIQGVTLAGKTGTAELKKSRETKDGKENGWFIAFDTEDPELMISMMIEDVRDRGGSHYVAPKITGVMKQFLK